VERLQAVQEVEVKQELLEEGVRAVIGIRNIKQLDVVDSDPCNTSAAYWNLYI
jgi:hypothetical protein